MTKTLIIVRGLPGSGKSSFASFICDEKYICTADDYHMKGDKYDWKPENTGMAHRKCQEKCEKLMMVGWEKVVVANTSTTEKEMKPYYDLAKKHGYRVFSVIVENRHNGMNAHNVPSTTLLNMRDRFSIKL